MGFVRQLFKCRVLVVKPLVNKMLDPLSNGVAKFENGHILSKL